MTSRCGEPRHSPLSQDTLTGNGLKGGESLTVHVALPNARACAHCPAATSEDMHGRVAGLVRGCVMVDGWLNAVQHSSGGQRRAAQGGRDTSSC